MPSPHVAKPGNHCARWRTVNAAWRFRIGHETNEIGELTSKTFADVIAIPFDGKMSRKDCHEAVMSLHRRRCRRQHD